MDATDVVDRFFAAVQCRDLDAIAGCFDAGATYANVPEAPVVGPAGVRELFRPIVERSERIVWDVVSRAGADDRVHVERLDRFWIEGAEYIAPCHGVFEVDVERGVITAVRDYVDLASWRARLGDALLPPRVVRR
jgi:limonene-1,2-epoxide hydrolase